MMQDSPHSDNEKPKLPGELEVWLKEKPFEEAKALEDIWNLAVHAQKFDVPSEPDPERFGKMRNEVFRSTAKSSTLSLRTDTRLRLVSQHWLKMAAAVVLLVLAGSVWWTQPITFTAPVGDQLSVKLSDGSTVSMNSGTRLAHNRSFGSTNRRVKLKGEAFFDVAHDDAPFVVETFNGTITVLGTRFNVRAWESDEEPETVVALEQGSVLLSSRSKEKKPVVLEPGQVSRISGSLAPTPPEIEDIDKRTAWRAGGLYFVDIPVGVAVDEIKRRYDVNVQVEPLELRQERITLVTNGEHDAETALAFIARVRNYTLEKTNGVFLLKK